MRLLPNRWAMAVSISGRFLAPGTLSAPVLLAAAVWLVVVARQAHDSR
jgi:hypothetical protein